MLEDADLHLAFLPELQGLFNGELRAEMNVKVSDRKGWFGWSVGGKKACRESHGGARDQRRLKKGAARTCVTHEVSPWRGDEAA